jgi:hypothetical protein
MTAQWTTILEVVHPNGETIFYLYTMGSRIHLRIDCNFCSVHEEITHMGTVASNQEIGSPLRLVNM